MKRLLSFLLGFLVCFASSSALAQQATGDGKLTIGGIPQVVDTIGLQPGSAVTVGVMTPLTGYFALELFGSNTSDMDVRSLLTGYSTVAWTRTHGFAIDSNAVSTVQTETLPSGNRVYTITVQNNLIYNNGQRITAKDYVFSLLLSDAPAVRQIGGFQSGSLHIVGMDEYASGTSNSIAGVRLLSEFTFSLEVKGEFLPYFYGLGMLNVTPYPATVIAPGCDVFDDGEGVYIGQGDLAGVTAADGYTPGEFSTEMLRETLLNPETGYAFNPQVTSGPYSLESFDRAAGVATFVVNPNYVGNYEGQKPHIERIRLEQLESDTMLEKLIGGEVDVINKVTTSDAIDQGLAADVKSGQYLRTGLAYLAFACEDGPTASLKVRLAIAHCIDKRAFTEEVVGSRYGMPVFGYYGLGQWMFNQTFEEDTEKGLPAIDTQAFVDTLEIKKDLSLAEALLVEDGWTLNASGQPFEAGRDAVRYKQENGVLTPLTIRFAKTQNLRTADLLVSTLQEPLVALGFELTVDELPFEAVINQFYRKDARTYDMSFIANNFSYIFDPFFDFNTADEYQGLANTSGLRDEELMRLSRLLRETPPADMHLYVARWLDFQARFVEVMPLVPLYSNLYYDFYANDLQDYDVGEFPGWAPAILYAHIGEDTAEQ